LTSPQLWRQTSAARLNNTAMRFRLETLLV
jgi:hypothetical protein